MIEAALGLVGTIAKLAGDAIAARAAGDEAKAKLIEQQLADATADFAAAFDGLPGRLKANSAKADAILDG